MTELLKIDPYLEKVYPVDIDDSLVDLCRQIGARRLTIAGQQSICINDCSDAAYCDDEALYTEPLPPAFRLRTTGHIIYGCALWHRVTQEGRLQAPAWTQAYLSEQVEFLGFTSLASAQANRSMLDDESLPLEEPDED
jgi:hypothetical protein